MVKEGKALKSMWEWRFIRHVLINVCLLLLRNSPNLSLLGKLEELQRTVAMGGAN